MASNCPQPGGTITRLLGLGNEILADDAFGIVVAREAQKQFPQLDVVCSSSSGFSLLDEVEGASRLLVVDTIQTGSAEPGALRVFSEAQFQPEQVVGPHFMGLFETVEVARHLGLEAPGEIQVIAVEAFDCITVGGAMHPKVQAAIPAALRLIGEFIAGGA